MYTKVLFSIVGLTTAAVPAMTASVDASAAAASTEEVETTEEKNMREYFERSRAEHSIWNEQFSKAKMAAYEAFEAANKTAESARAVISKESELLSQLGISTSEQHKEALLTNPKVKSLADQKSLANILVKEAQEASRRASSSKGHAEMWTSETAITYAIEEAALAKRISDMAEELAKPEVLSPEASSERTNAMCTELLELSPQLKLLNQASQEQATARARRIAEREAQRDAFLKQQQTDLNE